MHFMYVVTQFSLKREQTSTISSCKQNPIFCISFEDQRLEQTDFTVVHDSSSIGAGPSVALFKTRRWWIVRQDCVLEGRHQASHMAAAQEVFSVDVPWWS